MLSLYKEHQDANCIGRGSVMGGYSGNDDDVVENGKYNHRVQCEVLFL